MASTKERHPLERAAYAILSDIRRQGGNYSLRSTIGPTIATDAAINLHDLARAVLQAIREPSEGMVEAGERVDNPARWADEVWRAMIDAALEVGPSA